MKEMTAKELVERYSIRVVDDHTIQIFQVNRMKREKMTDYVRAHKQEIIDYAKAEEAKRKEYEAKVAAIPGIKEIEDADRAREQYRSAWNRSFASEDAAAIQRDLKKPASDPESLRKQYPQAAAYLKMRKLSCSSNYVLASIGKKALQMVVDGSWEEALRFAEAEEKKNAEEHLWD